jgi:hypothetical protein
MESITVVLLPVQASGEKMVQRSGGILLIRLDSERQLQHLRKPQHSM